MMNKRITGIILTISMLVSLLCVPYTARAAIGIEHEAQVSKLNAFGILSGYPDEGYKASAQVSAKDFITAAYKVAGVSTAPVEEAAAQFGIKASDTQISVAAAEGVLLTALKYNYEADLYGGYPDGYQRVTSGYGLLSGASQAEGALTNDTMAVMLYNALDLRAVDVTFVNGSPVPQKRDETIMDTLDIYEGRGTITGTEYASMNGSARGSRKQVIIDNNLSYSTGRTYANDLLGYDVEYYYDDENTLLWVEARNTTRVSRIAEVDIISIDGNGISFYNENDSRKNYIFSNAVFVYNGVQVNNPDFNMFIPKSGYIVTVDSDGDNRIEVVYCESYEYYLVGAKNTFDKAVNDYVVNKSVSLNEDAYSSVKLLKNDNVISFDDIAVNDVLGVMKSADGSVITAVVSPYTPITGSVTEVSEEYVLIDGTQYYISTAYGGDPLTLDNSGSFYRDINGNIVRYAKGANKTSKYAYLINAYFDASNRNMSAIILTAGGTVETHKVRSKISHNGGSVSDRELYEELLDGEEVTRQLITYAINSSGELTVIDTANTNNLYSGMDEPMEDFAIYSQGHGRYRKNNMSFNSKYLIEDDTPIFVVPATRTTSDYKVQTAASLTNGSSYYISVYDIDEYMTAGAIVLDELESDPQSLKAARSVLVTGITEGYDSEEACTVTVVEGYQQGSSVTLMTKDDEPIKDSEGRGYCIGNISGYTHIGIGDVIQASLDSAGRLEAFRTMYKADESRKKLVIAPNDTPNEYEEGGNADEFADLFVVHGTVKSRSESVVVVESDTKRAHKITSGISVYVVSGRNVEKVTAGDIYIGDEVYLHTYQGNIQEVVIYR